MAQTTTEGASQVVESVRFSFMTEEDVRKHSVLRVTKPILLDNVGRPVPGGLYDPLMGPMEDDRSKCKTCDQRNLDCPGHCGRIELVRPIYHPLLFNLLFIFLQRTCFFCHHFMVKKEVVARCVSQLKLIMKGDVIAAKQLSLKPTDSSPEECEDSDMGKQRWTSLQFAEATDVINQFLRLKSRKCESCKAKPPKLEKPIFGWVRLDGMSAIDIGANVLRGVKAKKSANNGEDSDDGDESGISGLHEVEDGAKNKKGKSSKAAKDYGDLKKASKRDLLPIEVKEILEGLWDNEYEFCSFIGDLWQSGSEKRDYSMFFLKSVLVPPTKFRAPTKGGDSVTEHAHTAGLNKVLEANIALGNACTNKLGLSKIVSIWMNLQETVNVLFDSKTATVKSQREGTGICQLLEKKEGLFRQKMMGKRVNHACRSVISPDPFIAVNDIGIPPCFALKLSYPERVTPWNVEKLRQAIINGPDVHPGATHYSDKVSTMKLPPTKKARIAIARKLLSSRGVNTELGKTCDVNFECKTVYRHMQDGDVVLVNRQPTLHKPSIMAHIVRVLKGEKTLRLHYANCSTYNADFDGDEMNVHFPQDEISRSEAYNIVNANNQYARPSNGDPLRALIQDHIVSSVLLTKGDTFLDKEEFNQLLFSSGVTDMVLSSFSGRSGKKVTQSASNAMLLTVTPAILKPVPLWTGKQVITAVLNEITKGHPPFSVEKSTKLPVDFFKCRTREAKSKSGESSKKSKKNNFNEDKLLIRKNEFVRGVIDKAQFADYGLVHTVHELYGPNAAGNLLSVFSRLFTVFLQTQGFTCGVDDLIILKDVDEKRTEQLRECEGVGEKVLRKTFGVDVNAQIDPQDMKSRIERVLYEDGELALASLDRSVVSELNQCSGKGVMNDLLSDGLLKTPGTNCISLMTISGAKGSKVNFQQISSHLGQQDLEGKRVPRMVSGKTLPCFHPWDWSPRAGGFISDRFLSGLRPQEYYFHCMAGREGLVDTAVKTSRSGYLQRCLMKNLESLKVNYDCTVRDADGSIIQFQYGEDGVDVHRSSFIEKFQEMTLNQDMFLERCTEDMHNKIHSTLLFSLLFFITHLANASSKDQCNQNDKKTLLKIKKSLNNPYHLASWDPKSDCCAWNSLECDDATVNRRVISLTIFSAQISGQIPPEVGDLPYLQKLVFRKITNLTGQIPHTITKLKYLRFLRLSWTNLTGPVPEFLSQLMDLAYLNLSFNYFSGSIPSSLSLLPKLSYVDLSRNKLTGTIPESFGSFSGEVPDLFLSHNQLSGSIPKSLGNLDFNRIDFSRNRFIGDASMLFGANKTTFSIDLSRNMFQFDLSRVEIPKTFGILDLNHNGITGSIPVQWTETPFQIFNVSYNRLCGRIPTGGKLQMFDSYAYFHNKCLCGAPLDSCK